MLITQHDIFIQEIGNVDTFISVPEIGNVVSFILCAREVVMYM